MNTVITLSLLIAAAIHIGPIVGFGGAANLRKLYDLEISEPNLLVLMRHRAVLFGILGAFLALAAFRPALQPLAFVAGFISVLSYIWLARRFSENNANIIKVFWADVVALIALLVGASLRIYTMYVV